MLNREATSHQSHEYKVHHDLSIITDPSCSSSQQLLPPQPSGSRPNPSPAQLVTGLVFHVSTTFNMKFTYLALLATAELTLGARLTEQRRARHAERIANKRASGSRSSHPRIEADDVQYNETSHVSYSTNWAGAVQTSTGYTSVTGTIVVPTPAEGDSSGIKASLEGYSASAWVGIDGDTCSTAILQTGVDFSYKSGSVSFDAWYEWYPGTLSQSLLSVSVYSRRLSRPNHCLQIMPTISTLTSPPVTPSS